MVIINAGRDYLQLEALARQGKGIGVTVFGTMRPAVSRGVIEATAWSVPLALAGVAAVWLAARRAERAERARESSRKAIGPVGPGPGD